MLPRIRPLLRLSTTLPVTVVLPCPLSVPPWLFSATVVVTFRSRLAMTVLPALFNCLAVRVTSPVVLRLLSALTPASIMPLLLSVPPLSR
ncbi:hypothetical protein D3C81_1932170 [compost metagenome]